MWYQWKAPSEETLLKVICFFFKNGKIIMKINDFGLIRVFKKNIYIFILLSSSFLNGQIPEFPIRNTLNSEIYELIKKQHLNALDALNDQNENFDYKSILWSWRLFSTYLKSFPENKDLVIKLFFDRVDYEPVSFCETYHRNFHKTFLKNDTAFVYYKNEFAFMENICNCIIDQQNKDLKKSLIVIKNDDQLLRKNTNFMLDKEMQKKQEILDSLNLIKIEKIIKIFGYPTRKLVGTDLEDAAFLVLQHSNQTIIEKYIGLVQQEVDNRNLKSQVYAYMYDRLQMFKNLPQKYGTQFVGVDKEGKPILYQCSDLSNLNLRRYSMMITMLDNYPKPLIFEERIVETKK